MNRGSIALFFSNKLAMTCILIICFGLSAAYVSHGAHNQCALLRKAAIDVEPVIATNRDGSHSSLLKHREKSGAVPLRSIQADAATKARVRETYSNVPLIFEDSQGRSNGAAKFISRGNGYSLFLAPTEALLVLKNSKHRNHVSREALDRAGEHPADMQGSSPVEIAPTMLRMKFLGSATDPDIIGRDPLASKSNYFIGNDRKSWRSDIPNYARVNYRGIYPGIDLVFYGNQRQLEYDFIVGKGADPEAIQLQFEGADKLEIDTQGNLILHTADGPVTQHKPIVYQLSNGTRQSIDAGYVIKGKDQVSFQIAAYDSDKPLIIDPILVYSTYLGGTYQPYSGYGWDFGIDISLDSSGNVYVVGETYSTDFPAVSPFQGSNAKGYDVFISKLNADGTSLLYSSYLGGGNEDSSFGGYNEDNGSAIALDAAGNIYVVGLTNSTDFPTTANAYQSMNAGGYDAFVTVLNAAGNALLYSSYLGGSGTDYGMGIGVDSSGNALVTGLTNTADFPTHDAFQSTYGGGTYDAFVAKVNPSESGQESLVYSTFLGGGGDDRGLRIRLDASGNAYVAGATASINFPTKDAFQSTYGGGAFDAFVTKINGASGAIIYSSFLGGSGEDRAVGIALDNAGNAYVAGRTASTDFQTTSGAFDTSCGTDGTCNNDGLQPPAHVDQFDAFVTKLNAAGNALVYSTYLGGEGDDRGIAVAVDAAGHAYAVGTTKSTNFPCVNPLQDVRKGDVDIFITKLDTRGSSLIYSTYLGGSAVDQGDGISDESAQSITVDSSGNAYVTGYTLSTDFPVTANAFQTTNREAYDSFIVKIASLINDTIGVFSNGNWYLDKNKNWSWDSMPSDNQDVFGVGIARAVPVVGDWNSNGNTEIGIFVDGNWYLDLNGNGLWDGTPTDNLISFGGGVVGAVPVTGAWTGTGTTMIGIYKDGTWYLDLNGNGAWDGTPADGLISFGGGVTGAVPVTGDWTGTGTTMIGIYKDGTWYLDLNGNGAWDGTPADGLISFGGGITGAVPVTGDWTGTGTTKIGIYTDGTWYLDLNGNGAWEGTPTEGLYYFGGGLAEAWPVTGKW